MAQVGSKMALRWRQDGLKMCLLGVLWPSWVVLGMRMVLGSSWVCFESFLATSWGVLGRLGVSFWMFCEQLGLFRARSYPRASLIELRSGVARDMCF